MIIAFMDENAVGYMLFLKLGIILCQVMLYGELMIRRQMPWAIYSLIFLLCWTELINSQEVYFREHQAGERQGLEAMQVIFNMLVFAGHHIQFTHSLYKQVNLFYLQSNQLEVREGHKNRLDSNSVLRELII